jgi:hypothetical protein
MSGEGLLKRAAQHSNESYGEEEMPLLESLSEGLAKFGSLRGFMLKISKNENSEALFQKKLASMVSGFGTVSYVEGGYCLLLFDEQLDGELLGHHLLEVLPEKQFFPFEAGDPREALKALKPYL